MDKKEIMKHIVGNDSDDEIKWEFYHEIIYSQFKVCSLWTDSYDKTNLVEAEEWFAELKQQWKLPVLPVLTSFQMIIPMNTHIGLKPRMPT